MHDKILANAELVRTVAREQLGIDVAFDETGVRWLDGYIDRQREAASPSTKERLPGTLGSYLGECLRRSFGGDWIEDPDHGWALRITPRMTVYPFNKVRKQLASAQGESVLGFYSSIPLLLRGPGASKAAPQARRPWWKWW